MSTTKRRFLRAALLVATVALVTSYVIGANSQPMHEHMASAAMPEKPAVVSLATIHGKQLPAIQNAVKRAIQHIEAQQYQAALAQLEQAQNGLEATRTALGQHVKPAFVNDRCPIMGSRIDVARVNADLLREYQGQTIAFCCAGCPSAWDQLSDAEKQAKLKMAVDLMQPGHEQLQH
ncbi:MAG: hypothetical protein JW993_02340 [Sedimentisphaerales bacterium]|nr:hypothetical protein [Sedimentisphaerales bacterium]